MAKRPLGKSCGAIGDGGDGKHPQVHLPGGDDFRNRGHSNGIGAQAFERQDFCGCFVARARRRRLRGAEDFEGQTSGGGARFDAEFFEDVLQVLLHGADA